MSQPSCSDLIGTLKSVYSSLLKTAAQDHSPALSSHWAGPCFIPLPPGCLGRNCCWTWHLNCFPTPHSGQLFPLPESISHVILYFLWHVHTKCETRTERSIVDMWALPESAGQILTFSDHGDSHDGNDDSGLNDDHGTNGNDACLSSCMSHVPAPLWDFSVCDFFFLSNLVHGSRSWTPFCRVKQSWTNLL